MRSIPRWLGLVVALGASLIVIVQAGGVCAEPPEAIRSEIDTAGSAPVEECDPLFDEDCQEVEDAQAGFPDPWERMNRGTLIFNRAFDTVILDPITRIYSFVMPGQAKLAIRRLFDNLDSPAVAINDGLQLEWTDMGVTITRFVINSSIGLAGLFDPAAALGIDGHHSDFGQTLTLAGLRSGPYVILPLIGPTTLRDGTGVIVDAAFSPLLYILGPLSFEQLYRGASLGLSVREEHFRELEALEQSSIDFYAAMRSAFYQARQAEIWANRDHRRPQ